MADIILFKGVSHTALPVLAPREPAVVFDPMTGDAKLWIGTTVGNEMVSGGVAGATGLPGAGMAGVNATAPPAGLVAALGTGAADDAPALQAQAIYARDHAALPLLLAPGVYRLLLPLIVGAAPATGVGGIQSGWTLRGSGPNGNVYAGTGGVTLTLGTPNQPAVLLLGDGGPRSSRLTDLTLDGGADANATKFGLWNGGYTWWSALAADHVIISNVDTAVAVTGTGQIAPSRGSNGEMLNLSDCHLQPRKALYVNSTDGGQAFPTVWEKIDAWITQKGGTAFTFGGPSPVPYGLSSSPGMLDQNGGNNFSCFGLSLSMSDDGPAQQSAASLTNTFAHVYGAESLVFIGNRTEHVGTLIEWISGSAGLASLVTMTGILHDGMNGYKPLLKGGGGGEHFKFIITGCTFHNTASPPPPLTFAFAPSGGVSSSVAVFTDCDFDGYSSYAALLSDPHVVLVRCRTRVAGTDPYVDAVHV